VSLENLQKEREKFNSLGKEPEFGVGGQRNWVITKDVSSVDDTKTFSGALLANEAIARKILTPLLILRCKEREVDAFIVWGDYLGNKTTSVVTRIDNAAATIGDWLISTDFESSFHSEPTDFIEKIYGHFKLVARVTPYGESPVTMTFYLKGSKKIIKELRSNCYWK
jgi:type VI secretion system protein VasI